MEYVDNNDLMEPNQSAYRINQSTETTLLKVTSDILKAMQLLILLITPSYWTTYINDLALMEQF